MTIIITTIIIIMIIIVIAIIIKSRCRYRTHTITNILVTLHNG